MKKTRNEILLRISKLESSGINNLNLLRKWRRILRKYDLEN